MTPPGPGRDIGLRMIEGRTDQWVAQELERCGCQGNLWETVQVDFWMYSDAAFRAVVRRRHLTERTASLRRKIALDADEAEDLAADDHAQKEIHDDAFVAALDLFVSRTCGAQGWSEGGRASLRGYFFNGVLLQAANPVRDWRAARRRGLREVVGRLDDPASLQWRDEHPGPEERLVASVDAEVLVRALQRTETSFRQAIWLRVDTGRPWGEIACEVGLTEKALEHQRRRFRTSFNQQSGNQTGGR